MAHDHPHPSPTPTNREQQRAFRWGAALNAGFVLLEAGLGWWLGSLALLADAVHNLGDVLGLLLAWLGAWLATRPATQRHTYGYKKATVLSALGSGVLLLISLFIIAEESIQRLLNPTPVPGGAVLLTASAGVLINGVTMMLFLSGSRHDLNMRSAFLHLAADTAVSLGVVIGGALILFTGRLWIDPLLSLVIAVVVLVQTVQLLREAVDYSLDAVPEKVDAQAVRGYLQGLPQVHEVHDLHIWPLSTTETALSAHLVVDDPTTSAHLLPAVQDALRERFGVDHATLQLELHTEECTNNCP